MATPAPDAQAGEVLVRPMQQADLMDARKIFRVAFGTFLGVPDPDNFWSDREYVFTRWLADPSAALAAEIGGRVVGSNFAARWGSFGFFGPLTILPEFWNQGIAQKLLVPTMELFAKWGVRETGLFTFAQSAKHVGLYQKFGFWPRFLTAIMSNTAERREVSAARFSRLSESDQKAGLEACRKLSDAIFAGLDLRAEIQAAHKQNLGETLLLWSGSSLDAFAVCHCGEGTEAGRDTCYVKFAAAAPGASAEKSFERLLDACGSLAAERDLHRVEAGVNLGRSQAYRLMMARGYRSVIQGVAMHRPDAPAFNRPDVFAIDDWR
jgi:GNAT superfamily N-acetyltransferase